MATWIHRCVSLQCWCIKPSWQPEKSPMPPFLSAHPPSFPQIFWMTWSRDRWIRPGALVSLPGVSTTCQIHRKVTLNLITGCIAGLVVGHTSCWLTCRAILSVAAVCNKRTHFLRLDLHTLLLLQLDELNSSYCSGDFEICLVVMYVLLCFALLSPPKDNFSIRRCRRRSNNTAAQKHRQNSFCKKS